MIRAALYARFSTDLQNEASIADQLHASRGLAKRLGVVVLAEEADAAISGQSVANRPGLQAILGMCQRREIDLVICEHTDRLSRSLADTAVIYEDLRFWGIGIHTVNQGEISTIHIGMSATMSALFIEETRKKTRRGLAGVARSGRVPAGLAYGYDVRMEHNARGERIRGLRQINETEADVVRRIFAEYAAGMSPRAIAARLDAEGVPPSKGARVWTPAAIRGHPGLNAGMLRNDIYRGLLVFGRNNTMKDRRTAKVRKLAGTGLTEIERVPMPELRIVDDELWDRVQERLASASVGAGAPKGRREKRLLAGLVRCSCCGGPMALQGKRDYLCCVTRAQRGAAACSNKRTPSYAEIEARTLDGVEANLLHPEVVADAVEEFRRRLAETSKAALRAQAGVTRELADVTKSLDHIVAQVAKGMPWDMIEGEATRLRTRKAELERQLGAVQTGADIALHPSAADVYLKAIYELRDALAGGDRQTTAAKEAVRKLVSEVRVIPLEGKGKWDLEVEANLAPVLNAAGLPVALFRFAA